MLYRCRQVGSTNVNWRWSFKVLSVLPCAQVALPVSLSEATHGAHAPAHWPACRGPHSVATRELNNSTRPLSYNIYGVTGMGRMRRSRGRSPASGASSHARLHARTGRMIGLVRPHWQAGPQERCQCSTPSKQAPCPPGSAFGLPRGRAPDAACVLLVSTRPLSGSYRGVWGFVEWDFVLALGCGLALPEGPILDRPHRARRGPHIPPEGWRQSQWKHHDAHRNCPRPASAR